jgi:hypothetical protein
MRFYEFAPQPNRPVLKISQQAQQQAVNKTTAQPSATPTPFLSNTAPTPTAPESIKVFPRAWQHEWIQKKLAADIAKSAQTVKPSADDLALASMRYAEAQRAADDAYAKTHNVERVNRRLEKRD